MCEEHHQDSSDGSALLCLLFELCSLLEQKQRGDELDRHVCRYYDQSLAGTRSPLRRIEEVTFRQSQKYVTTTLFYTQ